MARVLSGAVLLALIFSALWWLPPVALLVLAEGILLLALREYFHIAALLGTRVAVGPAIVTSCAVCAAFAWPDAPAEVPLMVGTLAVAASGMGAWRGGADALPAVGVGMFPALYLALPLGALVAIRDLAGREAVLALVLTVAVSDIAQLYTGRLLGRHPLAPSISPKKTIEGAVGGALFGVAAFWVMSAWWLPDIGGGTRALMGVALVGAGILGDLFESMLKRSAGVKDASQLIPGHGGMLDRIDALLFAAPVFYLVVRYAR